MSHGNGMNHVNDGDPYRNDDEYSATVLGSHWIQRPEADPAVPDRVEGEVLRFGPGVTAAAARRAGTTPTAVQIWHGTLPGTPPVPPGRKRRKRRYVVLGAVAAAVAALLAWWYAGPRVAVRGVTVTAEEAVLGCDRTARVVATVRTDGRPGTLTYHWERSDGTRSAPLRERVTRGQETAELRLLWTFQGPGTHRATARLVVDSPAGRTAWAGFLYRCA